MTSLPQLRASAAGVAELLLQSQRTLLHARRSGALQPIVTESAHLVEAGLPFSLRWVSSLARKDEAQREPAGAASACPDTRPKPRPNPSPKPRPNPFLPPDPQLIVAALGEHHWVVLNKFPVIDDHLLLVTRTYEAQTAPLGVADWAALAAVVGAHGGLGFYNGGADAGASQPHRHLQWVPDSEFGAAGALAPFAAGLRHDHRAGVQRQPVLPWRHAFVALDCGHDEPSGGQAPGAQLRHAFALACAALGLAADADPMPPYNLLLTRQWLLLVPRRCERWQGVSVNALGFAGSLFARERARIDTLRAIGPLALLRAVSLPA